MQGSGLKKAKIYKSNFTKRGPFGMFLRKIKHPETPAVTEMLKEHRNELLLHCENWREFSIFREWSFFKDQPVEDLGETRFREFTKEPNHRHRALALVNDSILNYYLFKKLDRSEKEKLNCYFQKRYLVPVTDEFSKDFISIKGDEWVRKTDFILWMNHYLENCVSKEFLELSSFEIALKLGQLWNQLPYKERMEWRLLAAEDESGRDPKTIKKYKKIDLD